LIVILAVVCVVGFLYWSRNPTFNAAFRTVMESSEDAATTTAVKTALALSRRVSAFDVNVDTDQGVVTLRGQVPNPEVKIIAAAIAADTAGVGSVRNQLTVNPAARPNPQMQKLGDRVADLEIKATIQAALLKSPELKNIEVQVEHKVVTLSGTASTSEDKYKAEQIAQSVVGVEGLTSYIAVEKASPEDADAKLARQVEFEFFSTKAFDLSSIQVGAHAGVVTLNGTVRSRAEQLLAGLVAERVSGVGKVTNNLTVQASSPSGASETQEPAGIQGEADKQG
jgi:hyperosmotically inducible protein